MRKASRKLEDLIVQYEKAIFTRPANVDEVNRLSTAVEDQAQSEGYDNHFRLMSIHTQAEQACIEVEKEQGICLKPIGKGWEITHGGRSLGIFGDAGEATGIARRLFEGSMNEEDIVRRPVLTRGKRR